MTQIELAQKFRITQPAVSAAVMGTADKAADFMG